MMTRRTARGRCLAGSLLAAVALLGLILATGTVLHSHVGAGPALYNQEHDLTTLSGVGSAAATPEAPSLTPLVAVASAVALAPALGGMAARSRPDSRAPPTS